MFSSKPLAKDEALKKIKHYCAYQERSHREVKNKLFGYGLRTAEVEELIANMIENNYLNEERFATLYAGGKFRIKQWGRKKIEYELQQKGVNKVNIKIALKEINEEDYLAALKKLAVKKWSELKGVHYPAKQARINAYLLQKGYEHALIAIIIKDLIKSGNKT